MTQWMSKPRHRYNFTGLQVYKHDYIVIYRVNEDIVYIAGFFHMLENYRMKL